MLNDIVNLIFFKEMFQNTEELAQKGRYEAVCHGTSVNAICYMAQWRKLRTQYGNKSSANYHNATISHYLYPSLNHTVFMCSGGH